jgi:hypothetical protein
LVGTAAWNSVVSTVSKQNATFSHQAAKFNDFKPNGVFGRDSILKSYFEYYEHSRTHLSLEKDAPISRTVQASELGRVIELPQVGGLHHRYERRAA